jgi:hypothetical protein
MKNWPKSDRENGAAPHGRKPGNDSVQAPGKAQYPQQTLRFMDMRVQFQQEGTIRKHLGDAANKIGAETYGLASGNGVRK